MSVPAYQIPSGLPLLRRLDPALSRRFLQVHEVELRAVGLDPTDPDVPARPLAAFPNAVARDLESVEDLANGAGADALSGAAIEQGVLVASGACDAAALAMHLFLQHRGVFDRAHGRCVADTVRGFAEFPGRTSDLAPVPTLAGIVVLETELGADFRARGRSAHCRVRVIPGEGRAVYAVSRGALARVDEALGEPLMVRDAPIPESVPTYLTERRIEYRPHRQDVVVYDKRTARLRIHAPDAQTAESYRRAFGRLFFDDEGWFGTGPVVSLAPLVTGGAASLRPTPGLRDVTLTRLVVHYGTGTTGSLALDAADIWGFLAARLVSPLGFGDIIEATFKVKSVAFPRGRSLVLKVPNRVAWGRVDESAVRAFLEQRGFLAGPADSALEAA